MSPTRIWSKFCTSGPTSSVTMSPAGPLSVTVRFAESTASTEAVTCATRSAMPLPGAVATIVAPAAAGSSGCASSADGARLAAARISVLTLLRIRISMSGDVLHDHFPHVVAFAVQHGLGAVDRHPDNGFRRY